MVTNITQVYSLCVYTQAKRGARSMADVRVAVRDNCRPLRVQDRLGTVRDLRGAERRAADQRRVQRAPLRPVPGQTAELHRHRGSRSAAADVVHRLRQVEMAPLRGDS